MKVLGLTGGVACGKSTAMKCFQDRGIPVIDTDLVAKQILNHRDDIRATVMASLGTCDRTRLRELVFENPQKRRALEDILHPEIYRVVQDRLNGLATTKPRPKMVMVVVPLLFEAGWEPFFDDTVAVICDELEQIKRLATRDQTPADLAQKMVRSQMSNAEKSNRADYTLTNNHDLKSFEHEVNRLIDLLDPSAQ